MPAQTTGSLSATGSVTLTKSPKDTLTFIQISGTYGTVQFVVEGSKDGSKYAALAALRYDTGAVVTGTISPSDNATQLWKVPSEGLVNVRARVTAIASGTADFDLNADAYVGLPLVAQTQTQGASTTFGSGLTFNGATTANVLAIPDNLADALNVKEGANSYLKFTTTDSGELILVGVNLQLADAKNVVLDTTTGTKIGTATTQKLGFYNATPVARPSAYTQTYSTADKTHANMTSSDLTDNTGGTANTTLENLADGTTYANDHAKIENNFADIAAEFNKLRADVLDAKQLLNSVVDDLQALGLVG